MTRMNHASNNSRRARRELQSEASFERAQNSGQDLNAAEQAKYRTIAERYADVSIFCADINSRGRWITKGQAATLEQIEAERRGKQTPSQPRVSFSGGAEMITRQMTEDELRRM